MTASKISVKDLIKILEKKRKKGKNQYIIFDIDDTIIDTTKRKEEVYKRIKSNNKLPDLFPDEFRTSYNIIELLKNKNFDENSLIKANNNFLKYFLSNEYLKYDSQFPGVEKVIYKLSGIGFKIIYLTGRHYDMFEGTMESFKMNNIPIDNENIELVMKKDFYLSDIDFKKNFINNFDKKNNIICIIDNDSETCNELGLLVNDDTLIIKFNSTQKDSIKFNGFHLNNWN
ncbi:MAG: HAD hydrolase-like protein [Candidatus Lokiarchaeota archaeon]|nr:HAD hydrolase-like protein [Candidatus Lokiarchaeota archaeon]